MTDAVVHFPVKLELMSRFHNRNFELLEPYDAKVSRTVLRGEGSSNAPDLLDLFLDNSDENLRQFERTARNMQSLSIVVRIRSTRNGSTITSMRRTPSL